MSVCIKLSELGLEGGDVLVEDAELPLELLPPPLLDHRLRVLR